MGESGGLTEILMERARPARPAGVRACRVCWGTTQVACRGASRGAAADQCDQRGARVAAALAVGPLRKRLPASINVPFYRCTDLIYGTETCLCPIVHMRTRDTTTICMYLACCSSSDSYRVDSTILCDKEECGDRIGNNFPRRAAIVAS